MNPVRFKWACSYMWRHNAKCENALNLKTLSDTLWRRVTKMLSSKKTGNCPRFFRRPDVKNVHFVEAKRTFSNHTKWKSRKSNVFFKTLMTKIANSLRRNANFHAWVMRLPSKNDHDFEMSFHKVPQIPRFQLLTPKFWISNRQPLTGRRINHLPSNLVIVCNSSSSSSTSTSSSSIV